MRLVAITCVLLFASCRTMGRRHPPADPATQPVDPVTRSAGQPERTGVPRSASDTVSTAVAAIIDSIETAVRDSIAAADRDLVAAVAARDSALVAARRDSVEAARRDSIAAAARRDSVATARRDSVALVARRDSISAAARRDSIAAAARRAAVEEARRDSVEAARQDSITVAARRDSLAAVATAGAAAGGPTTGDALQQLRDLGPSYIPYDEGPDLLWNTESQAQLTMLLLPIVRAEGLPARTQTYLWILVTSEGSVDRVVLQTSSGNDAFDQAAEQVAGKLRFRPALRGLRAVPTWVVREISLIMQ